MTRTGQGLDDVANAVAVLGPEALGFTERKASLDEALRGVPGLTVQNRRDYGLTGGVALSVRAPPSEPNLGIRGLAVIQDGIPLTTTDGTTEPGSVDLGAVRRIEVIKGPSSVLYGNAAGGVINLVTEIDPTRRLTIRPDLQAKASVRWVDEVFLTNANEAGATNWAYTVVDLRFGWVGRVGGVDVQPFAGIDNLLDERYNSSALTNAFRGRYYRPSPGREIYAGFTLGGGVR